MRRLSTALAGPTVRLPLLIGGVASVLLLIIGLAAPRAALHGWLIAFASIGGIPLGAFAWLMIHRLTGGDWGRPAGPLLDLSSGLVLPLFLLWLPIGIGIRLVYTWAADPGAAGSGVATYYLNGFAFAARSLIGLGVLGYLAWRNRTRGLDAVGAGLALLFYAVFMNFAAFDWILSIDPRFNSSAFGVQIIVQQLLSALALVALLGEAPAGDAAWRDIGALLLATSLGESYLILMTLVVFWYGDLPDQADWYLRRTEHFWRLVEIGGVLVGAVGPMLALLFARVRDSRFALRIVAACLLFGVLIQDIWLVAPVTEASAGLTAVLAIGAMAGLSAGVSPLMSRILGDRDRVR